MATKQRSAAQKRATARMQAAARARRAGAKKTKPAAPKRARRTMAASKAPSVVVVKTPSAAPARAKPASGARRAAGRARAAAGKAMTIGKGLVHDVAIPAAIGAGAASATDVVYGLARKYLPERMTTGPMKHLTKAAVGVGAAVLAQKVGVKPAHAKAAAIGVLTVGLHRAVNEQIEKRATNLQLNGVAMTVGALGASLPGEEELNGLEALGAMAGGDSALGASLEFAA